MYLLNEWLLERDDRAARIGLVAGEHPPLPAAVKTIAVSSTSAVYSELMRICCAGVVTSIWLHLAGSAACYTGAVIGIGFLYHYFAPKAGCGLNIAWITLTLIFAVIYTAISVSPWRSPSAGLLTSGVVFIYTTYLVWAALTSEPYGSCSAVSSTKALQVLPA